MNYHLKQILLKTLKKQILIENYNQTYLKKIELEKRKGNPSASAIQFAISFKKRLISFMLSKHNAISSNKNGRHFTAQYLGKKNEDIVSDFKLSRDLQFKIIYEDSYGGLSLFTVIGIDFYIDVLKIKTESFVEFVKFDSVLAIGKEAESLFEEYNTRIKTVDSFHNYATTRDSYETARATFERRYNKLKKRKEEAESNLQKQFDEDVASLKKEFGFESLQNNSNTAFNTYRLETQAIRKEFIDKLRKNGK